MRVRHDDGTVGDLVATVTTGIVSAVRPDAAISPGNSGGPIILEDGRVVGISDFESMIGPGLNFGIHVAAHRDRIRGLLDR